MTYELRSSYGVATSDNRTTHGTLPDLKGVMEEMGRVQACYNKYCDGDSSETHVFPNGGVYEAAVLENMTFEAHNLETGEVLPLDDESEFVVWVESTGYPAEVVVTGSSLADITKKYREFLIKNPDKFEGMSIVAQGEGKTFLESGKSVYFSTCYDGKFIEFVPEDDKWSCFNDDTPYHTFFERGRELLKNELVPRERLRLISDELKYWFDKGMIAEHQNTDGVYYHTKVFECPCFPNV